MFNFTDCIFHLISQVKRLQVVTEMYLFAVSVPVQMPVKTGTGQVGSGSAHAGTGGTEFRCCVSTSAVLGLGCACLFSALPSHPAVF